MRTIRLFLLVVLVLPLAGCGSFEPYDYEKDRDARFNLDDSGLSVGFHRKRLYLKKEFGKPKKNDKK